MLKKKLRESSFLFVIFLATSLYAASANLLTNPGFESGTTGWESRSCSITTVTSPVYKGSLAARAYSRTATWHGIQQNILDIMQSGKTYVISARVQTSSSSSGTVKISIQKTEDGTTTYTNVASSSSVKNTSWTSLSNSYTYSPSGTVTSLYIYVEGPDSGIDIYIDDANVYGEAPDATEPNAAGTINVNTRYQTIEGFGAAGAWYEGTLTTLGSSKPEIYDVLFGDLGLDIYRLRNAYSEDDGTGYMNRSAQIITAAEASLGRSIKVLVSGWSPPDSLKSTGDTIGGTLAGGPSSYVYSSFAAWWANSIAAWDSYGVDVNYVSIQNEPDYEATWDSCRLEPSETTSYAGYDTAFEAVYDALYALYGSSMPNMIGPEITGFNGASGSTPSNYISAMDDLSHVYGYAHHMYNINAGDAPDSYLTAMQSFNTAWGSKPLFQTEYEKATGTWPDALNMAWLLHNALTVEEVSGYLYWDLFWGSTSVGLVSITTSSYTINSDYYGFKHFSKFIDSDWQRVDAAEDADVLRMSAYISPDNSQLSVVIINTSANDVNLSLNFTGFTIEEGDVYRTTQTQNCVNIGTYDSANPMHIPASSITTLALSSSTPDTTPPAAPTGLSAITDDSMVTLNWNDNSESDLNGYNVYRSTTSTSGYSQLNSSLVSSSNYTDSTAVNNTTYYYVVTAVDTNDNESDYSNEVSAIPAYQNCSDVQAGGNLLASDLNADCYVNFADLEVISEYWLRTDCDGNNNCEGADFETTDGTVDFKDFTEFSLQWMQCNDPQTAGCTPNW